MNSSTVSKFLRELSAILKEWWNAEESEFCCGISIDPQRRLEHMRTGGSCCGVRV